MKPWFEQTNYQRIDIKGFDAMGEPHIRILEDGSLVIMFNFMPPIDENDEPYDDPVFEAFEMELEKVAGAEVEWEDEEVFLVPKPTPQSAANIKAFLEKFWKNRQR